MDELCAKEVADLLVEIAQTYGGFHRDELGAPRQRVRFPLPRSGGRGKPRSTATRLVRRLAAIEFAKASQ
jgi:hypothetical protein